MDINISAPKRAVATEDVVSNYLRPVYVLFGKSMYDEVAAAARSYLSELPDWQIAAVWWLQRVDQQIRDVIGELVSDLEKVVEPNADTPQPTPTVSTIETEWCDGQLTIYTPTRSTTLADMAEDAVNVTQCGDSVRGVVVETAIHHYGRLTDEQLAAAWWMTYHPDGKAVAAHQDNIAKKLVALFGGTE